MCLEGKRLKMYIAYESARLTYFVSFRMLPILCAAVPNEQADKGC